MKVKNILCALIVGFLCAAAQGVTMVDLGGPDWRVSQTGADDWFPAQVPGCVHTDLLADGRIEDPFFRENEKELLWIGSQPWTYRKTFQVDANLIAKKHLLLRFDGLDTLATVRLNGKELGKTDNMFRTWEFPVKDILKAGKNALEVTFDAAPPIMAAKEKERQLAFGKYPGSAYIRKMPCNFGWDWGPTLVTCGIWRPVSLIAFDTARLNHLLVLQDHSEEGAVHLDVQVEAAPLALSTPVEYRVKVFDPAGQLVAENQADYAILKESRAAPSRGRASRSVSLTVNDPQIWWPTGMGGQPLYRVQAELFDLDGNLLDTMEKRIGLRTIESVFPTKDTMRHFKVNGVPFFAKGANFVPPDPFLSQITDDVRKRLIQDALDANMNMLRIWGGGYYLEDEFFDLCDEMGLMIWQDFIFACGAYPGYDPLFRDNVRCEVRDNVRRIRHHPSIAIWCGNNEVSCEPETYAWEGRHMSEVDYNALFYDTIGEVVALHDPQTPYVHGSPGQGEVHSWQVWHGDQPFERLLDITGMVGEYGFQSYPEPDTVEMYTLPEDRTDLRTPVMEHHQRGGRMFLGRRELTGKKAGAERIRTQSRHYFGEAKTFNDSLWLSQINQAYGMGMIAERMRVNRPTATGVFYWQFNDIWGGPTWASVDYLGRWKALHYEARRFYAPVMVSGVWSEDHVGVWLINDRLESKKGTLEWRLATADGEELAQSQTPVKIEPNCSQRSIDIDILEHLKTHGESNLLLWLRLQTKDEPVSEKLVIFTKPGNIQLVKQPVDYTLSGEGKNWTVEVSAKSPALWVWLDVADTMDEYSDNFFHLNGNETRVIQITLDKPLSEGQMKKALRVRSVMDIERKPVEDLLVLRKR